MLILIILLITIIAWIVTFILTKRRGIRRILSATAISLAMITMEMQDSNFFLGNLM